jgi:Flp pilus assembly protein TadG
MEPVRSWFKRLSSSSDRRRSQRLESPLLAAYYWDGAVPMAHQIRNISSTGFYLLTRERWHPGTVVTMTLQRTDIIDANAGTEHYISVLSKVVRLGEDGVGFAFVPLETKDSGAAKVSRSKPVGKKALGRFLEQIKLDQGCAIIGLKAGEETLSGQDTGLGAAEEYVMKRLKDESGQALVISALCMTCLLGFVALATDVGIMLREKRLLQIAADSAAVAGATELNYGDVSAAAQAAAAQNGFTDGSNGASITVNGPPNGPLYGLHAGNGGYVEVIASQSQPTFFMGLFGRSAMTVTVRAVATLGVSQGCVYTLGTLGTDIAWNGSGNANISTCSILDDSSSANALILGGSGNVTAQSIGVVGGFSNPGSGTLTPNPPTVGIVPVSDPLGFLTPPANPGSCLGGTGIPFPVNGSSPQTLQPGCYDGLTLSGSGPVTLVAGLYYIDGPFSFTGSGAVSGTGVTIYLTNNNNASFTTSGPGALNLTAPAGGTYNGILLYQNPGNTASMSLNGSGALNLQGIIYAPGSALTLNGSGGSQLYTAIVTNSLVFNGSGALQDYALKNASSPLTAAKLVE